MTSGASVQEKEKKKPVFWMGPCANVQKKKQTKAKHIFLADDWWLLTEFQPKEAVAVYGLASPSTCCCCVGCCRCDAARSHPSQTSASCGNSFNFFLWQQLVYSSVGGWRQTLWSNTKLHMWRSHASFWQAPTRTALFYFTTLTSSRFLFFLALANALVPLGDHMDW